MKVNKPYTSSCDNGFIIIEVLVSLIMSVIILTAFSSLIFYSVKTSNINISELKANMYLRGLIEITKDLEQSNWNTLKTSNCYNSVCHPEIQANNWVLISGEQSNNGYISSIKLDVNEIGTDIDKKIKVIAKVEWHDGYKNRDLTLETYIYNYSSLYAH